MSDEWTRAWEAATGMAPGESQHRVERERVAAGPAVGDEFVDGINPPGFTWRVEAPAEERAGCVLLRMFRDGEATESVLSWPADRWGALVEKQQLSPAVRA